MMQVLPAVVSLDDFLIHLKGMLSEVAEPDTGHIASVAQRHGAVVKWTDISKYMATGNEEVARHTVSCLPRSDEPSVFLYNIDLHNRGCCYLVQAEYIYRPSLFHSAVGLWVFRPETIICLPAARYLYLLHHNYYYTEFLVPAEAG